MVSVGDYRFKVGDMVCLSSEAHPMAITGFCDLTGAVECSWLSKDRILRRAWLPPQVLQAAV